MPPERRRTYGRWAESRPEGYVCPYRRCGGKRYTQLRHYREHLRSTHANERVPAPEYRAPDAPENPPPPEGPDNEQSGTAVPANVLTAYADLYKTLRDVAPLLKNVTTAMREYAEHARTKNCNYYTQKPFRNKQSRTKR